MGNVNAPGTNKSRRETCCQIDWHALSLLKVDMTNPRYVYSDDFI